jgi:hypothetical protein
MKKTATTATANPLLPTTATVLPFAGKTISVGELKVRQSMALMQYAKPLGEIDFDNIASALQTHAHVLLPVVALCLDETQDTCEEASNSELLAAVQGVIAHNKTFFLQTLQLVLGAAGLKAMVQAELQKVAANLQTTMAAQPLNLASQPSPSLSPTGTGAASSTTTAGANSPPTSMP